MYIYYELSEKEKDVTIKNHKSDFKVLRELFKIHEIDFSSISKLKGDKKIMNQAFIETISESIT